jgi:hypothetical protein
LPVTDAEHGNNLATVLREAQYAANNTVSLGVALSSCHLPQNDENAPRLHPGHAELGMGIHGEPGATVITTQNSAEIVKLMVGKLTAALPVTSRLAIMLNNLGGVSVAEMAILTRTGQYPAYTTCRLADWTGPAGHRTGYERLLCHSYRAGRKHRKSVIVERRNGQLAGSCATTGDKRNAFLTAQFAG